MLIRVGKLQFVVHSGRGLVVRGKQNVSDRESEGNFRERIVHTVKSEKIHVIGL